MSYRGIENLYGNIWTILDGVNVNIDRRLWIAYTSVLQDQAIGDFGDPYEPTGFLAPTSSGWLKYPDSYESNREGDWAFGNWTLGGLSSTYMSDYYTAPANFSVPRYPIVGGAFDSSTAGGLWALNMALGYGDINPYVGARLQQIPLDIDFWRY